MAGSFLVDVHRGASRSSRGYRSLNTANSGFSSIVCSILRAFDAGQGLSEHTSPYQAIIAVLEGEGTFTIAGKPHVVGEGEMIIMPATVPHAVEGRGRFKMMLTMVHGE